MKLFKNPATKIPLSIAESEYFLRGATDSTKSKLRKHILKKTGAISYYHPKSVVWIYDVSKILRSQCPELDFEKDDPSER